MVTNPDDSLDRLRTQLQNNDRGATESDRDLLLRFSDRLQLLRSEYSTQRHEKLLRHMTILSEGPANLDELLRSRDHVEDVVRWVNQEYSNEETNKDYRIAIRMFGKRLAEDGVTVDMTDDYPASVEWIPTTTSRDYDPEPDPGEMLDWEADVRPMIEACLNARDKALIATAWDAGPRSGELQALTVGDVSDHKHGLQITVDGKTGQRSVPLITSVPYVNKWLDAHPRRGERGAPLWCSLTSGEALSYQMFRKIPREAAGRAGVDKPVTLTNFRKSSASHLASQGVNQAVLEDHHGWTRGSKAAARYIAVFGEASDREIARAHGVDVESEEPEPTAGVECPRCGRVTPREDAFCAWCHQALEPGAVAEIEREQDQVRRELLKFAKDHPELLETLEELEPLLEAVGGDPAVVDLAQRFAEATE